MFLQIFKVILSMSVCVCICAITCIPTTNLRHLTVEKNPRINHKSVNTE